MVLIAIWGYFLRKRKTRVFPYITWVCELFSTTLFIFFTNATWIKNLLCLAPLGFTKSLFFLHLFIWLHAISLGFYGKLYLKLYLFFLIYNCIYFLVKILFIYFITIFPYGFHMHSYALCYPNRWFISNNYFRIYSMVI